ncbi:MAG: hypothetical protein HOV80_19950 [Polyangiaceae bacterium]|nr:hypothetical protein [Polyangiaceae bacterium]
MKKTDKRKRERIMFAAPIVATAVFAAGCPGRVYKNPGPPTETPPDITATAAPSDTAAPAASGSAAPTTSAAPTASASAAVLPDAPKDGGGKIVAQADGTCLYVFPHEEMHCPPGAHCNPGPPQEPLRVKCPDGTKKP